MKNYKSIFKFAISKSKGKNVEILIKKVDAILPKWSIVFYPKGAELRRNGSLKGLGIYLKNFQRIVTIISGFRPYLRKQGVIIMIIQFIRYR